MFVDAAASEKKLKEVVCSSDSKELVGFSK
jgi:hypothetical protein